jgi:hypothetical protein
MNTLSTLTGLIDLPAILFLGVGMLVTILLVVALYFEATR